MPPAYHAKLQAQLALAFGDHAAPPAELRQLLRQISDSYQTYEAQYEHVKAQADRRTEQLIASTARAYSFLDSLNMGLILCDVNPEVVLTNQPAMAMLAQAAPSEPAAGWNLARLNELLAASLPLAQRIADSLAGGQPFEQPELNLGQLVLRLYIAPMINDGQAIGCVLLFEDITGQKKLERTKDEFLSIASHELRTPLTAIRGNAAMIKRYYSDQLPDDDCRDMVGDIHESSVRLIAIVNDFLDVSALEQNKMRMNPAPFALSEVVGSVLSELQALCAAKGIQLDCHPSVAAMPMVLADKQRIKQVVYNLVGNALKFTEAGSITVQCRQHNGTVYTFVTDTGRGMPADSQQLLFRKFQQAGSSLLTRDTTKGTGLGLYISKLIVEQAGGRINLAYSAPGRGSSFVFSLPEAAVAIR